MDAYSIHKFKSVYAKACTVAPPMFGALIKSIQYFTAWACPEEAVVV